MVHTGERCLSRCSAHICVAVMALVLAWPAALVAQNPAPSQTFYMPLPEDQTSPYSARLLDSLRAINTSVGTDPAVIYRVTNIALASNGAYVYYDQKETDSNTNAGFVADIANPTPSQTYSNPGNLLGVQIWGDNNPANGAPPNIPSDVLTSGSVIKLENHTVGGGYSGDFDGGDKFAVAGSAGVVMLAYPTNIGTIFCGGTEILDTSSFGTSFRMVVGVNVNGSSPSGNDWNPTEAYFIASQDSTTVYRNGTSQGTINQGQSVRITGLNRGDTITASAPVGAIQFTGDAGSDYEMRWETMLPTAQWTNSYVLPGINGDFTSATYAKTQRVFFFAPSSTTVTYARGGGAGFTFTVDATNTLTADSRNWVNVPNNNGARFTSPAGTTFWGVSVIGEMIDDQGIPMVPTANLTEAIVVPQGWGCTGGVCGTNDDGTYELTADRSAVFITPDASTASSIPIYVDYDGLTGPRSPVTYSVGGLDTIRLLDADQDMTGALIYTLDGTRIVGTWLQFSTNVSDDYALDLGTLSSPAAAMRDYGDAPTTYGAAGHRVVTGLQIGPTVDFEPAYGGNAAATLDDTQYNGGAVVETAGAVNDTGVTNEGNATGACNAVYTEDVSTGDRLSLGFTNTILSGDWFRIRARSGDGDGGDETATVSFCNDANANCAASTVTLTVEDPDTADPGPDKYYDFAVPAGIGTTRDWLRIVWSAGTFQVDCAATMKTTPVDDEDGVVISTDNKIITATVTVTNTTGTNGRLCGYLDGGVNSLAETVTVDGDFDRTTPGAGGGSGPGGGNLEERCAAVNTGTTNGTRTLSWYFPATSRTTTYLRLRLSTDTSFTSDSSPSPTVMLNSGEVEDYWLDYRPTHATVGSVTLESALVAEVLQMLASGGGDLRAALEILAPEAAAALPADADAQQILDALTHYLDPDGDGKVALVRWETVEERGTVGFFVERAGAGGGWSRINHGMLRGLVDASMGGEYVLADPEARSGNTYSYRLIELEAWGTQREHGPYTLVLE